jgi:hypothetical protein
MMEESFAFAKYPKKGKCRKSCFAIGWHRVGLIPVLSLLDGGLAGDILSEICFECGKDFGHKGFLPKRQPNMINPPAQPSKGE